MLNFDAVVTNIKSVVAFFIFPNEGEIMDLSHIYSFEPTLQDEAGKPCPKCHGRKVIKNPNWFDTEEKTIDCTLCHGNGWVYATRTNRSEVAI